MEGIISHAKVANQPSFTVTRNKVSGRCRFQYGDNKFITTYANDSRHVYYFLKYLKPNSEHYIKGNYNYNSYKDPDTGHTYISQRLSLTNIHALPSSSYNDNNECDEEARDSSAFEVRSFGLMPKLEFMVNIWVLLNWTNGVLVLNTNAANYNNFCVELDHKYEELVLNKLIPEDIESPIKVKSGDEGESLARRSRRPGASVVVVKDYVVNKRYEDVNIKKCVLKDLVDVYKVFDAKVLQLKEDTAMNVDKDNVGVTL